MLLIYIIIWFTVSNIYSRQADRLLSCFLSPWKNKTLSYRLKSMLKGYRQDDGEGKNSIDRRSCGKSSMSVAQRSNDRVQPDVSLRSRWRRRTMQLWTRPRHQMKSVVSPKGIFIKPKPSPSWEVVTVCVLCVMRKYYRYESWLSWLKTVMG